MAVAAVAAAAGSPRGGERTPRSLLLRSRLFWKVRAGPAAPPLYSWPHPGSPAPPRAGPGRSAHQSLFGRGRHLANQRPPPPPALSAGPAPRGRWLPPWLVSASLCACAPGGSRPRSHRAAPGTANRPGRCLRGTDPHLSPLTLHGPGSAAAQAGRRPCPLHGPAPVLGPSPPVCRRPQCACARSRAAAGAATCSRRDALQLLIGCGGGGANVARAVRGMESVPALPWERGPRG